MPTVSPDARLAVIWALGLSLGTMGHALVFFDTAAAERLSATLDGPGFAWTTAVVGFVLIASTTGTELLWRKPKSSLALVLLTLIAWTFHELVLRFPWLVREADPGMRATVASAILSRTFDGVPLLAFLMLIADALLFTHATLAVLRAAEARGFLPESIPSRGRRTLGSVAVALYLVGATTTVGLATGRL
jgi:hypothetical protein